MKNKYLPEAFPIYHTGYMTGKDVFSVLIFAGLKEALETYIEKENICILNEAVLKTFYSEIRMNSAVSISDSAVALAMEAAQERPEEFGLFKILVEHTDWGILAGSTAYDLFAAIGSGKAIYKCTAAEISTGRMVLLDFMEAGSLQELARIVRFSAYRIAKKDITGSAPRLETDGILAVRPPYDEWGMTIKR